jgi:hypothetical protein
MSRVFFIRRFSLLESFIFENLQARNIAKAKYMSRETGDFPRRIRDFFPPAGGHSPAPGARSLVGGTQLVYAVV